MSAYCGCALRQRVYVRVCVGVCKSEKSAAEHVIKSVSSAPSTSLPSLLSPPSPTCSPLLSLLSFVALSLHFNQATPSSNYISLLPCICIFCTANSRRRRCMYRHACPHCAPRPLLPLFNHSKFTCTNNSTAQRAVVFAFVFKQQQQQEQMASFFGSLQICASTI